MTHPRRPLLLAGLAALGLAAGAAGCGKATPEGRTTTVAGPSTTSTVERTTRVEVVKQLDADGNPVRSGGFDPASVYRREALGKVVVEL